MEVIAVGTLVATLKKLVDFVKYVRAGDIDGVVTQVVAWVAGIGLAVLAAASDLFETLDVNGVTLGSLNGASLAFVGIALASTAGFGADFLRARDNTDSAATPPLIPTKTSGA